MSIQSEINRIAGAKSDIADAIEDKGVTVPSGTKLDGMANLIGQISDGSGKLNSTQAADAYDPTATYAVGDKVSYAGNVYSCISAISTPEAWDSTHWDQVDPIQDQVDDVRNTLTQLDQNMAYVESGNTASRTYAAGDFISWKGTLYTASTAIPATTAFAVGTNLAAVVDGNNALCGGLNSLNSSVKTLNGYVNDNGLDTFISKKGYYNNTTLSAIKSEFDSAYGSIWAAIVYINNCTGMPNITGGAVLMVKSDASSAARCLAFNGSSIETATIT